MFNALGLTGKLSLSPTSFQLFGQGIDSLFGAKASKLQARGNEIEAENYRKAAGFADFNALIEEKSTAIRVAQAERQKYQVLGGLEAGVAASGFTEGGSAEDLLRESAQQASLVSAVTEQQGLVDVLGYQEQARSYRDMASASDVAARAARVAAKGQKIGGYLKMATGVASMFMKPV